MNELRKNIVALVLALSPLIIIARFVSVWIVVGSAASGVIMLYPVIKKNVKDPLRHKDKKLIDYVVANFKDVV